MNHDERANYQDTGHYIQSYMRYIVECMSSALAWITSLM